MALRPEKDTPANRALVDGWDDLPIDLPYGPEEFIDMIDSWEIIALIGVPDGADLGILAMFINAIRKMHGVDHDGARESLEEIDRALDARSSLRKAYFDKVMHRTVEKRRDK